MLESLKNHLYFKYNQIKRERDIGIKEIKDTNDNINLIFDRKKIQYDNINKLKTKKNITTKNNAKKSIIYFHFYIFICNFLLIPINSEKKDSSYYRKLASSNSIILTIKGTGSQSILYSDFSETPDSIELNDETIELVSNYVINIESNSEKNYVLLQWNSDIITCNEMFRGLTNLIEINLFNFEFPESATLDLMFRDCENLETITFNNNVDPYSINGVKGMFYGCKSLKSLDLSNFDTHKVSDMSYMFANCFFLSSLNLLNFDTSLVTNMEYMFSGCSSLQIIDLSNFNGTKILSFEEMFSGCTSLVSLDLSNFHSSDSKYMKNMFTNCVSLKSLNVSNIHTNNVEDFESIFSGCSSLRSFYLTLTQA